MLSWPTPRRPEQAGDISFAGYSSAWSRTALILVPNRRGRPTHSGVLSLFEYGMGQRLRSVNRAERISVADPGHWRLQMCRPRASARTIESEVVTGNQQTSVRHPDFLGLAATDPDLLTLRGLASTYILHGATT